MQVIYAGPEEVIRENIDLYFTIYAQQLVSTGYSKLGKQSFVSAQDIYFERCPPERFGYEDDTASRIGITGYYWCPSSNDVDILGALNNNQSSALTIQIDYCN